jgi:hypothetical protein
MALPCCCPGCAVVGRHRFHVKRDAFLPVGRVCKYLVRGTGSSATTFRDIAPTVEYGSGVVRRSPLTHSATPKSRRNPRDILRNRPQRSLLGSARGLLRLAALQLLALRTHMEHDLCEDFFAFVLFTFVVRWLVMRALPPHVRHFAEAAARIESRT